MRKVIITGDSHAGALKWGKNSIELDNIWPQDVAMLIKPLGNGQKLASSFFEDCGDHANITEKSYRPRFTRLPLEETEEGVDTVYGICALLHTAHIWRHPDWQKNAPFGVCVKESPVSRAVLKRAILDRRQHIFGLIDILRRNGKRVFIVEAPRPFSHHRATKKTRKPVIAAVDAIVRSIMLDELRRRDIPVVRVPEKVIGADGFMLDMYRSVREGDQHHGNTKFGRIMLEEILSFLRESNFSAATMR